MDKWLRKNKEFFNFPGLVVNHDIETPVFQTHGEPAAFFKSTGSFTNEAIFPDGML